MSKSRPWSTGSAPCRLEWRRSRLLGVALAGLGVLAALVAVTSELPVALSVPLGLVALAYGTRLARRELRHSPRQLVIPAGDAAATLDGTEMHALRLHWRGPMVLVAWRDSGGRRRYLPGWPDNMDAAARRELRLAIAARIPARAMRSMAP